MKHFAIALTAALCMSTATMATTFRQDNKQRQMPTTEQRVQHRTDRMVKRYGLDKNQTAQLLKLNTEYEGKMGPRHHHGPRPDGQQPPREVKKDKKRMSHNGQRPERKGPRPSAEMMEKMKADRNAYNQKLKTIMTPKQYEQYMKDESNMKAPHQKRMDMNRSEKQKLQQKNE